MATHDLTGDEEEYRRVVGTFRSEEVKVYVDAVITTVSGQA